MTTDATGPRPPAASVEPFLPAGTLARQAQPPLHVDGLVLRPWRDADAPAVVRAYQDPDIHRWHGRSMDVADARAWIAGRRQRWHEETGADWAVTDVGEVVGRIALRRVELTEGWAEVAYWVLPGARGGAVAPRSLRALGRWAFHTVGFHRLELAHSTRNPASCRVAAKVGFTLEGTKRRQGLHHDGWHDMHLHGLLADEAGELDTLGEDGRRT